VSRKILAIVAVLLLAIGGYGVWRWSQPDLCEVCERPIHPGMHYTIETNGGHETVTCCPRCGLRLQSRMDPSSILNVWAVDYDTRKQIDARKAFYVEGSAVHECCSETPRRNLEGDRYDLQWDRCLPSLVAFGSRDEAQAFRGEHGGEIVTYERLQEEIQQ
jgi:hypothetical protein